MLRVGRHITTRVLGRGSGPFRGARSARWLSAVAKTPWQFEAVEVHGGGGLLVDGVQALPEDVVAMGGKDFHLEW